MSGGTGNDTLTGGTGADTFIFSERGPSNVDHILDYSTSDKIDLSGLLSGKGVTSVNMSLYVKLEQTENNNITVSVDPSGTGSFSGGEVVVLDGYDTPGDLLNVLIDDTEHHFTV